MWSALQRRHFIAARRPSAGAVTGRRRACLAVRAPPAACRYSCTDDSIPFVVNTQQLRGLGAEVTDFFVLRGVLLHPQDGPVVEFAGLVLVAQFQMCHGQEETVRSELRSSEQLVGPAERKNGTLPRTCAVLDDTEVSPVPGDFRRQFDGSRRGDDGAAEVSELGV